MGAAAPRLSRRRLAAGTPCYGTPQAIATVLVVMWVVIVWLTGPARLGRQDARVVVAHASQ